MSIRHTFVGGLAGLFVMLAGVGYGAPVAARGAAVDRSSLSLCGRPGPAVPLRGFPRVLRIGSQPLSVAVSERTGRAYAINVGERKLYGGLICRSSLTMLDAATGRFMRAVPTGEAPGPPVVDDRDGRVFVITHHTYGNQAIGQESVEAFDLQGRAIGPPKAVSLGELPVLTAVDPSTHRLFVLSAGILHTFRATDLATVNAIPVTTPAGGRAGFMQMAVDERDRRVFVLTLSGLYAFDARTGAASGALVSGRGLEAVMAVDAQTGRVFLAQAGGDCKGGSAQGGITVFNGATGAAIRTISGQYCFGFAPIVVDEPLHLVLAFAGGPTARAITALDSRDGRPLQAPRQLPDLTYSAVDGRTGLIYFTAQTCGGSPSRCIDRVRVLDPLTWRVVRTTPVPHVWQMAPVAAAQAHRVFVANPYTDTVEMLQTVPSSGRS